MLITTISLLQRNKNLDNLLHMVNVELIKVDNWLHSN